MRLFGIAGLLLGLNACGYGLEPFVMGDASGGLLTIEPTRPVNFGSLSVGTFGKQEIRLVAEGAVGVEDVYLDGDSAFRFEATPPVPKLLGDQSEMPIKIIFEPLAVQSYNATFVVLSGGFELERRVQGAGE